MMAMMLEKLPTVKVVARAKMGSLIILAHMISLASVVSRCQQVSNCLLCHHTLGPLTLLASLFTRKYVFPPLNSRLITCLLSA